MTAFDLVVLGSGGGPDETNLSAYLVKPHAASWKDGIIALEAGSGQGALKLILAQKPDLFDDDSNKSDGKRHNAATIYSFIRCFLVTHAHLDHVSSLVLSAGSLPGPSRRIYGTTQTLKDLASIFSDRIWPQLVSWDENNKMYKLFYHALHDDSKYKAIFPDVSVQLMLLSHGRNITSGVYESAAYFIRHDPSKQEFLFLGDVEPDSIAENPRTANIWRIVATKFPQYLSTIFIECSWPSGRPDSQLYGHLTPEHLVREMTTLATQVVLYRSSSQEEAVHFDSHPRKRHRANVSADVLRNALNGLRVYIIHCKDGSVSGSDRPANHVITDQVRALIQQSGLGAEVLPADQGMKIEI